MKDIKVEKVGVVIIQWLRDSDPKLGVELYKQLKSKGNEKNQFFAKLFEVANKQGFIQAFENLVNEIDGTTILTLHIVSHGCEDGLGLDENNFVDWKLLFNYTRQLNEIVHNTLLIILSSCVGGGIISCIEPEKRAPYMAFIGNTREVYIKDAQKGFKAFYEDYLFHSDLAKCLDKLNNAIDFSEKLDDGRNKTNFFVLTAETTFDEVFNPDRDPKFFEQIVNKLLPPNENIPQELRIKKAKELFRKRGEKLRPYFTFQE